MSVDSSEVRLDAYLADLLGSSGRYIQSRFFMDVHPPLAKLLITLMAFISGFQGGQFDFKDIGKCRALLSGVENSP